MKRVLLGYLAVLVMVGISIRLIPAQEGTCRLLTPEETRKFLPDRVPMETDSIAVDSKICSALQFPDKTRIAVAVLVTAGLSNEMRQKYQYVFISETRIRLDRWNIQAGMSGLAFEPAKGTDAPTRVLIVRDFLGAEVDRPVLQLDPNAPDLQVSLTPKGPTGFELRLGKYVISGVQR